MSVSSQEMDDEPLNDAIKTDDETEAEGFKLELDSSERTDDISLKSELESGFVSLESQMSLEDAKKVASGDALSALASAALDHSKVKIDFLRFILLLLYHCKHIPLFIG